MLGQLDTEHRGRRLGVDRRLDAWAQGSRLHELSLGHLGQSLRPQAEALVGVEPVARDRVRPQMAVRPHESAVVGRGTGELEEVTRGWGRDTSDGYAVARRPGHARSRFPPAVKDAMGFSNVPRALQDNAFGHQSGGNLGRGPPGPSGGQVCLELAGQSDQALSGGDLCAAR